MPVTGCLIPLLQQSFGRHLQEPRVLLALHQKHQKLDVPAHDQYQNQRAVVNLRELQPWSLERQELEGIVEHLDFLRGLMTLELQLAMPLIQDCLNDEPHFLRLGQALNSPGVMIFHLVWTYQRW